MNKMPRFKTKMIWCDMSLDIFEEIDHCENVLHNFDNIMNTRRNLRDGETCMKFP